MIIPFFVIVIEKLENGYYGYSPNLLGSNTKGSTREEVESAIFELAEKYVEELRLRYEEASQVHVALTTGLLGEKITCLAKGNVGTDTEYRCSKRARKDGLCGQHWRMVYSHKINPRLAKRICLLCGEKNQYKLDKWDDLCPAKQNL
jgi:predicted RNase H-like HicB family nuclease